METKTMTTSRRWMLAAVLALACGCGSVHDVGQEPDDGGGAGGGGGTQTCVSGSDCNAQTQVCDVGTCTTACGANYPGAQCGAGQVCDSYICRQSCAAGAGCASGASCINGIC